MDRQRLVHEFLEAKRVMQLATVLGEQPWLCNVYYVHDDCFNIYWTSAKKRRHSQEILVSPKVAANIVYDEVQKQAVLITGFASTVPLSEVERVNTLYAEKFGDKPSRLDEVRANTVDGRAYWVLKPSTIALWDEVNFPDAPKQEVLP